MSASANPGIAPLPADGDGRGVPEAKLTPAASWSRELVKQIAADVGDAVIFHIETMYPAAVAAAATTFPTSVKNAIHNEIMAAVEMSDADRIADRIAERKRLRRKLRTQYRKMRENEADG